MHLTTNFKRFHANEHGMSSLQVVSIIAVAAVVMLGLSRIGGRGSDWMRGQTTALENEIGSIGTSNLAMQPGFQSLKNDEEAKSPMPPLSTLKLENTQSQIVLASGRAPNGFEWKNSKSRNGYVQASMDYLKQNNFDEQSIEFYLDQEFAVQTNTHLSEMKKSELNLLVKNASRLTIATAVEAIKNGTKPKDLMKKMVQKIAATGLSPDTWRLAHNLTPKNWTKLMKAFYRMSPLEQKAFAFRFGSEAKTGQDRVDDGFEKLAAVTIQKGLRAAALKKTKSAREIGEILDKASKLPLPKHVTETFTAYAKVLDTASVSIAKMLTSPDSPTVITQKIYENTTLEMQDALTMTRHLQEIYRTSPSKENIYNTKDIPDHPKPK